MKITGQLIPFILLFFVLVSPACNEEMNTHTPIGNSSVKPAEITDVVVENQPGQATIHYTVPKDPELLYIQAVYTMTNGKQRAIKASYYADSIVANGFADTLEHEVEIYAVSRSGVSSESKKVNIQPLEAPIWKVFRSIEIINSFGGYDLVADNETKADIGIIVTKKNEFNEYEIDNNKSVYTSMDSIVAKTRGLDTLTYRFGFLVRDHWGNVTDTAYKFINPLFEAELDRSKFKPYTLPGDAAQTPNTRVAYAWDGQMGWPRTSFTKPNVDIGPHMITMDLGVMAKLSRVWIRPYPEGQRFYFFSTMKRFEIYGSQAPSLSGALDDSWYLLGSYELEKPSGLPYGIHNQEDVETAKAGFNWEVDINAPKVRYLRIRCLENFGGGTQQSINELKVYGDTR